MVSPILGFGFRSNVGIVMSRRAAHLSRRGVMSSSIQQSGSSPTSNSMMGALSSATPFSPSVKKAADGPSGSGHPKVNAGQSAPRPKRRPA